MKIIWGYTPEDLLETSKEIGVDILSVKQLFSALLFKNGIKGISIEIVSYTDNAAVNISLIIDSAKVFDEDFSPKESKRYDFLLSEIVFPSSKIEVELTVKEGSVTLPISSIGVGMGFQKQSDKYLPTNHIALGLILPD